jgi:type III pantothenate kinase
MLLVIDIGNTSIKSALVVAQEWNRCETVGHGHAWRTCFERTWNKLTRPDEVAVSNVAGEEAGRELGEWCNRHWALEPYFARSEAVTLDIRNGYRDASSLGVDRWMSLIGARTVTRSAVAVVDCGTAVTVDLLNAANEFLGGIIMPGEYLGRKALGRDTSGIPQIMSGEVNPLGLSTNDCVNSGVHVSIIGGIERVIREMETVVGTSLVVLATGGGAEKIISDLEISVEYVPDLVLKGLVEVIR